MKKYFKLLLVLVLSFFAGALYTYASPPQEPSHDGYYFHVETQSHQMFYERRISIGETIDANFYNLFYKEERIDTLKCKIKGYFNTMEDKEVVLEPVLGTSFKITDEFVPNNFYKLYKIDLDCDGKTGTIIMKEQEVYNNDFYVMEKSPVQGGIFLLGARVHKGDKYKVSIYKDFKSNEVLNINYDSFIVYYGNKDDYFSVPVDHISPKEYEIDLKKATGNVKNNESYDVYKVEMIVNGKKYVFDNSNFNEKDLSNVKYKLNYGSTSLNGDSTFAYSNLNIYDELMSSVSIDKTTAKYNESVYLNLKTARKPVSGSIQFKNTKTGETFNSTIRDIDSKPYFVVPYTVPLGEYELYYISLKAKGNYQGKVYEWDQNETTLFNYFFNKDSFKEKELLTYIDYKYKINIEKDDGTIRAELLELDNKKITDEILNDIKKLDGEVKINVDASNDSVIKKNLFDAIKGTKKVLTVRYNNHEWVINGKDINKVKDVDVKIDVKDTYSNEDIDKKVKDAVILEFASNGELPCKSKIKVYNDTNISEVIKNKDVNLYLYDEESKRFSPISSDIKLDEEGFYELELDHNSTYVITSNKIKDKYLVGDNSTLILILVIAAVVTVLLIGLVVFLLIRSKKKKKVETPVVEPTPEDKANPTPVEENKENKE